MRSGLRRVTVIALAAIALAACSDGREAVTTATTSSSSTEAKPVSTSAPNSAPDTAKASIEVRDTSSPGWHGIATVIGPGGTRSAPLDSGSATTFDGLDEGVYQVTVYRESDPAPASGGTDIGTAQQTLDAGRYGLRAGDHAVVTCAESSCTGVL